MKAIYYIIIILFTPILLLLNFRLLVFNNNFYQMEFRKLGVYQNFSSVEIANFEARQLINFYCCDGQLSSTFYTQKERLHLTDVKGLINLVNLYLVVLTWALATCLIYIMHKNKLQLSAKKINLAGLVTIFSIAALWIITRFKFDPVFINFHKFSFDNNYWLLPKESNLIKLFPPQFFVDFANQVALQTLTMATLIVIFTHTISKYYASKKH